MSLNQNVFDKKPKPSSPVEKVWKPDLYKLQMDAPTPEAIYRQFKLDDPPEQFGYEYHGEIGHLEAEKLLNARADGAYLVRKSPNSKHFFTLSIRFNNSNKHYRVYYSPNEGYYLKEDLKRFQSIYDLVADGLVHFYMQLHASPIIQQMMSQTKSSYQQSPYMTLNRRKLRALSNDIRSSFKMESFSESNAPVPPSPSQDEVDILPVVYEKNHTFKVHTFKGLNWCELCANFLWGFTAQGVKCEDCGFIAHNKCSEMVPAKCVPDLKRIRGVFGTDLTTLVTAHQCTIPFIIRQCVEEVETRGMLLEGIYRVSGFADEIDALKLALDRDGEKTDMSDAAYGNINVIAGTLKLYLRLLPVPLITFRSYSSFMIATECKTLAEQIVALREAVKQLPQAHYNCLKYMCEHLQRVSSHYAVNKMNEHNLATVFAPTLIATPQNLTDLSQEIFMLSALITHCQSIFVH